ncbi:hypothetical protein F5Y18DRAFT_377052 [Xylariaceae sp. FL1019]|nr:hypothetical protein F5Y18DRAFT_377052 [Xylariaceae sp. FL1019]
MGNGIPVGFEDPTVTLLLTKGSGSRIGMASSLLSSALRLTGYNNINCNAQPPEESEKAPISEPRYIQALPVDIEPIRAFLSAYSGIDAADVDEHVYKIRDTLWDMYPYACVGHFRFLSLQFAADPHYQTALQTLLQDPDSPSQSWDRQTRLLDVGCCVGQVLRKLALDGVDSTRLYGTDIEPRFFDVGYDLFMDRESFQATFIVGDMLKQQQTGGFGSEDVEVLDGRMTFVHAHSFFHLFTWDDQVRAAMRIIRFLDEGRDDVMVFGQQVGTMSPRRNGKLGSDKVYLHNAETWQLLWDEVGERTGTRWRTSMEPIAKIEIGAGGVESAMRKMSFSVRRG